MMNWSWAHNTRQELCAVSCSWVTQSSQNGTELLQPWALRAFTRAQRGFGDRGAVLHRCLAKMEIQDLVFLHNPVGKSCRFPRRCVSAATAPLLPQHLFPHVNRCSLTHTPVRLVWGSERIISSTFSNKRMKSSGNSP